MIDAYLAVGLIGIAFALGTLAGHAIGYGAGRRSLSPRYRRVGRPE